MRVHVVDPPAYTPPYDRALCAALAAAGADVTLVTSHFRHGDVPPARGYAVDERFYRRGLPRSLQHVPDMLRFARLPAPDVTHWQWASIQELDWALLGRRGRGARVLTAHDVLPRVARRFQTAGQRRLYARMDAVVVHTEHGRRRLVAEAGVDPDRVHVIPHGAFTHLADVTPVAPPELADARRPAVLFFGLIKPYKGLDVLYDAWRHADAAGAELWVVGAPRMDDVPAPPPGVRVVPRFVTDAEAAWCLREAALTVLPYRDIEMSGVLFSALGLGRPLLLSDVGGFPEVDAAAHVPAGDAGALAAELTRLLGDRAGLDALAAAAAQAARTTYAWDAIARRHLTLYERLRR